MRGNVRSGMISTIAVLGNRKNISSRGSLKINTYVLTRLDLFNSVFMPQQFGTYLNMKKIPRFQYTDKR